MEHATLGGLAGAGEVISRPRSDSRREYRGTFFFRSEDGDALMRLCESRSHVEFEGLVDGERRRLKAMVTVVVPGSGLAYFGGSGDVY